MSCEGFEVKDLQQDIQNIAVVVHTAAQDCEGNSLALLSLLRMLESLHREIRDGLFQKSLPDNRQELYALLRDIEAEGGWPYIHRMRLRSLLEKLLVEAPGNPASEVVDSAVPSLESEAST